MIYECIDLAMHNLTRPMDSLDLQALPTWNKFQLQIETWSLGLQHSLRGIIAAMPVGRSHKPEKWEDGGTKFLRLLVDWRALLKSRSTQGPKVRSWLCLKVCLVPVHIWLLHHGGIVLLNSVLQRHLRPNQIRLASSIDNQDDWPDDAEWHIRACQPKR